MMRVLVYSRVRLMGESLVQCLESCADVSSVELCHRVEGLMEAVHALSADIVLCDMTKELNLADLRAVSEAIPNARLVALGIPETGEEVIACADAGCSSYVSNQASIEELICILRRTMQDECHCPPKIAARLLHEVGRRRTSELTQLPQDILTHREQQILTLVASGLANKEIAFKLTVSLSTVKNHLHNVFRKLRVRGRAQALRLVNDEPWLVRSA